MKRYFRLMFKSERVWEVDTVIDTEETGDISDRLGIPNEEFERYFGDPELTDWLECEDVVEIQRSESIAGDRADDADFVKAELFNEEEDEDEWPTE